MSLLADIESWEAAEREADAAGFFAEGNWCPVCGTVELTGKQTDEYLMEQLGTFEFISLADRQRVSFSNSTICNDCFATQARTGLTRPLRLFAQEILWLRDHVNRGGMRREMQEVG